MSSMLNDEDDERGRGWEGLCVPSDGGINYYMITTRAPLRLAIRVMAFQNNFASVVVV